MGNLCFNLAAYLSNPTPQRQHEDNFYRAYAPVTRVVPVLSALAGIGVWVVVFAALLH
jgi:hypothetical protein